MRASRREFSMGFCMIVLLQCHLKTITRAIMRVLNGDNSTEEAAFFNFKQEWNNNDKRQIQVKFKSAFFKTNMRYLMENDVWSRFSWIERKCDFIFHHFRKPWNPWMTIFPIFVNLQWRSFKILHDFTWNGYIYRNWAWMGFYNLELKWKVIVRNAKNYFQTWIFCEREFTDPSLIGIQSLGCWRYFNDLLFHAFERFRIRVYLNLLQRETMTI